MKVRGPKSLVCPSKPREDKHFSSDILFLTEAPQPHPTPRNGPETDPKQTQTDPNGPETDRNGPETDPKWTAGEHPNVPSFRFSFWGNIRQNHPFENHPLGPPKNERSSREVATWGTSEEGRGRWWKSPEALGKSGSLLPAIPQNLWQCLMPINAKCFRGGFKGELVLHSSQKILHSFIDLCFSE